MNILFLTHRLPYAPNRGDRIRAYYLLREMATFADVSLFSLVHDDDEVSQAATTPFAKAVATARVPHLANRVRGSLRLASSRPLTHSLLDAPDARAKIADLVRSRRPDLVVAYCSSMARFAMEPPLDGFPFVLDMVDVDSEKWRTLSERGRAPLRWIYRREAGTLAVFERAASERARMVLAVSEEERDTLRAIAPGANIQVVPNGVEVEQFAPPPDAPPREPLVVFCGVMDYAPNVEGVNWFIEQVWPRIRAARPDARFVVVGANPAAALLRLARQDPSIDVTGRVGDVRPFLWRAAVSVAPLRVARGLQNKVLEALAAGLPVVVTSAVRAGLPDGVDRGCDIADAPDTFVSAVVEVLALPATERRTRAAGSGVRRLGWRDQLASLAALLKSAGSGSSAREGKRRF